MKPIKQIFPMLAFLLAVLLFSCEKTENELYPGDQVLLKQIRNDKNEVIARFSYYAEGSIKASSEFSEMSLDKKWKTSNFEYAGGKVLKITGFIPGNMIMSSYAGASDHNFSTEFSYDDGKLDETTTNFTYKEMPDMNYKLRQGFAYPDAHTVEITTYVIDPAANSILTTTVYSFDSKGNIAEIQGFHLIQNERVLYYREQLSYDDQPNPFRNFHNIETSSANNLVEKRVKYDPLQSSSESVFQYKYEYNTAGFPSKRTTTNPNETVIVEYFDYFNL